MYIRDKLLKVLKVKNIMASIIAVFMFFFSLEFFLYLCYRYNFDVFTLKHARSTPSNIFWITFSPFLFIHAHNSKKRIGEAFFFNSYFEGNLSGYISFSELSEITGIKEWLIAAKLKIYAVIYMKKFTIEEINNEKQIVLYSKKAICSCKNCGAEIEKRIFFTGQCSYCGSSDLLASVITDNRYYSITNEMTKKMNNKDYYTCKNLKIKLTCIVTAVCFAILMMFISVCIIGENINHYNDMDYMKKLLLSGDNRYPSFEVINYGFISTIFDMVGLFLACFPVPFFMAKRITYASLANECSPFLAKSKKPFVMASDLPTMKRISNKIKAQKRIKEAICHNYLTNCSFEKHEDGLKIAVARKIVKDTCPGCGASIVGAVDEKYTCKYCGKIIMGVIKKA